jgi:hypothetical protein
MQFLRFLSASKMIEIVGYLAVAFAILNFIHNHLAMLHGANFDPAYALADEALAAVGAATLLIAGRLNTFDQRLKKLEEEKTTPASRE